MIESVQISSYTSRVARELRPQCRLSFFGTFLAVLALIFSDLKNTYSYVCFFLLLHPCCFRASGILRGLHTSCMGSRSNAVNVFAWNVVSDDTIRSLTLYLSIHFYAMICVASSRKIVFYDLYSIFLFIFMTRFAKEMFLHFCYRFPPLWNCCLQQNQQQQQ